MSHSRTRFDPDSGQVFTETSVAMTKVNKTIWADESPFLSVSEPETPLTGAKSLRTLCIESTFKDQRNIDPFALTSLPWNICRDLWEFLGKHGAQTSFVWKEFMMAHTTEFAELTGGTKEVVSRKSGLTDIATISKLVWSHTPSPKEPGEEEGEQSLRWLTFLQITRSGLTETDLISLTISNNLVSLSLDMKDCTVDRRIVRAWAESGGFQLLRVLTIKPFVDAHIDVMPFINYFPSLKVLGLGMARKRIPDIVSSRVRPADLAMPHLSAIVRGDANSGGIHADLARKLLRISKTYGWEVKTTNLMWTYAVEWLTPDEALDQAEASGQDEVNQEDVKNPSEFDPGKGMDRRLQKPATALGDQAKSRLTGGIVANHPRIAVCDAQDQQRTAKPNMPTIHKDAGWYDFELADEKERGQEEDSDDASWRVKKPHPYVTFFYERIRHVQGSGLDEDLVATLKDGIDRSGEKDISARKKPKLKQNPRAAGAAGDLLASFLG